MVNDASVPGDYNYFRRRYTPHGFFLFLAPVLPWYRYSHDHEKNRFGEGSFVIRSPDLLEL